jgi:transposase
MNAYSQDLRDNVLASVAADNQSNRTLAEAFGISESVIEKWSRRWRTEPIGSGTWLTIRFLTVWRL